MATNRRRSELTPARDRPRRSSVASYASYTDAERAVDYLSDQGFAVERSAIVGTGVHTVEQVTGRMTVGRAALTGAGEGSLIGLMMAVLFGLVFDGPDFGGLLLYMVVVGGLFGALYGALVQTPYRGWRDFASTPGVDADSYDVQVEEQAADQASNMLKSMPNGNSAEA